MKPVPIITHFRSKSNIEILQDTLGEIDEDLRFFQGQEGITETRRLLATIRNLRQHVKTARNIVDEDQRHFAELERRIARLEARP